MALRGILFQEMLLGALILPAVGATEINSSCIRKCGSVSIRYPFGTDEGCYLNPSFLITCNQTFNPPKSFLRTGPIDVTDISLNGELRVPNWVARSCNGNRNQPSFSLGKFLVSNTKNKFFAVGCNTVAYVEGRTLQKNFTTGCSSHCDSIDSVVNGSCNGVGCCQSSIPQSITSFNVSFGILNDHFNVQSFNPCSFGFLAEETAYNFSSLDLVNLQGREEVPLVLDWAVGNETCIEAKKNQTNYACMAAHSECYNFINNPGYRCGCSDGYGGNPYLSDGCKDIDECNILKPCDILHECINVDGAFKCVCAKGYKEQKWRNIIVCNPKGSDSRSFAIVLGLSTSVGLLVLLIGGWLSYKILKKRRMIKQKEKFFKRNGGLLLQQKLFSYEANVENTKSFTSKDLEKATDHFNVNRILGQGGQGTVYKGMLVDGRIVAIKKSKVISEGKLQEFINEVVILSQINHRNVVKLIGCCLETEVPLLVYEYVPNGTLAQYLSNQNEEFLLTWDMRLQIAIEVAEALYYLHSVASSPIYHRDIKSTNILLDDKYRAKVADFGTSRSITIDQTHLTTQVHGTWGYLDPEYFLSSQFTEKSDVYSFGVVLAELLTGEKVISSTRTEKSLVKYFLESIKENKF